MAAVLLASTGTQPTTAGGPCPNSSAINTTGSTLLVALVGFSSTGNPPPTDSQNNTWTQIAQAVDSRTLTAYTCFGPKTSAAHTFAFSGDFTASIVVLAFSGAHKTPSVLTTGTGNGSASLASGTAQAGDAVVTATTIGVSGGSPTVNESFSVAKTENYVTSVAIGLSVATLIPSASQAVNPTWTDSSDTTMAAVQLCFPTAPVAYTAAIGLGTGFKALQVSDGATHRWKLNETSGTTAVDDIGGLNGTYSGAYTLNTAGLLPGEADGCVNFGANAFVTIPFSSSLFSTSFTYEFIYEWTGTPVNTTQSLFGAGVGGNNRLSCNVSAVVHGLNVSSGVNASGVPVNVTGMALGTRFHVMYVSNGTTCYLYINGRQASTVTSAITTPTSGNFYIGTGNVGGSPITAAKMESFAFYPSALTTAQVAAHWNAVGDAVGGGDGSPALSAGGPMLSVARATSAKRSPAVELLSTWATANSAENVLNSTGNQWSWASRSGSQLFTQMVSGIEPAGLGSFCRVTTLSAYTPAVGLSRANPDLVFNSAPSLPPVITGGQLTLSLQVRCSVATTARFVLSFNTSSGAKSVSVASSYFAVGTGWTALSLTTTVPAGLFYGCAYIAGSAALATGTTFDTADLYVALNSTSTTYQDGNTPGWQWLGTAETSVSMRSPDVFTRQSASQRSAFEASTASDAFNKTETFPVSLVESHPTRDMVSRVVIGARTIVEAYSASDSMARQHGVNLSLTDALVTSDAVTHRLVVGRRVTEMHVAVDSFARRGVSRRVLAESHAASDSIKRLIAGRRHVSETHTASDSIHRRLAARRSQAEIHPLSTSFTRKAQPRRSYGEIIQAADSLVRNVTSFAAWAEALATSDTLGRSSGHLRFVMDVGDATDLFTGWIAVRRAFEESVPVVEWFGDAIRPVISLPTSAVLSSSVTGAELLSFFTSVTTAAYLTEATIDTLDIG